MSEVRRNLRPMDQHVHQFGYKARWTGSADRPSRQLNSPLASGEHLQPMSTFGYRLLQVTVKLRKEFRRKPVNFSECEGSHYIDLVPKAARTPSWNQSLPRQAKPRSTSPTQQNQRAYQANLDFGSRTPPVRLPPTKSTQGDSDDGRNRSGPVDRVSQAAGRGRGLDRRWGHHHGLLEMHASTEPVPISPAKPCPKSARSATNRPPSANTARAAGPRRLTRLTCAYSPGWSGRPVACGNVE